MDQRLFKNKMIIHKQQQQKIRISNTVGEQIYIRIYRSHKDNSIIINTINLDDITTT